MVVVTRKVTELLKDKLVEVYLGAGGLDGHRLDANTIEVLRANLVQKCSEVGLGFRMAEVDDKAGKAVFINMDRAREGDLVFHRDGITFFLDSVSALHLGDRELDCVEETKCELVLR